MKICIEANYLNSKLRSGLKTYTEGLINGMYNTDQVNEYVMLFYSLTRGSTFMPGPMNGRISKSVLRVPDRTFWGRQDVIDKYFLPSYLKKKKFDIFHRTAGYTLPSGNGSYKILTVHDLRTITIGDNAWKQNNEKYQRTIEKIDLCVAVSESTKRDLIHYFKVDENKIRVVPLGVDDRFKPVNVVDIDYVKRKYGIERPYLLSMGYVARKNARAIIQAFRQSKACDNYQLLVTCFHKSEYTRLKRDWGIKDEVIFVDGVTDSDMISLYSGARCFVFASLYEGFGLPILEAMACGTPVITSNISSCPEVAGDAAILVDPASVNEIKNAINRIVQDNALCQQLVARGTDRVKLFTWKNFALEMKEIYEEVAGGRLKPKR